MKVIFALFDNYDDAAEAVDTLLQKGFNENEMNAVVLAEVAKGAMNLNLKTVAVEISNEVGERRVYGLERLLGGKRPANLPDLGEVYAAGNEATILAATATIPDAADGFKAALAEFAMPEALVDAYQEGIKNGGLLFWLRASDEGASEAAQALREQKASQVAGF
jgi:hypothetical protein